MKKNFPWFKPDVNRKLIAKEIKKFTIKNNLTMGNAVDSLEKKLGGVIKRKTCNTNYKRYQRFDDGLPRFRC